MGILQGQGMLLYILTIAKISCEILFRSMNLDQSKLHCSCHAHTAHHMGSREQEALGSKWQDHCSSQAPNG